MDCVLRLPTQLRIPSKTVAYSRKKQQQQQKQTTTQETESLSVLREEVEVAVGSLKAGKSPGVDNIPSEMLKNGDEAKRVRTAIP